MTLTPASILTASELAEAARLSEERGFEGMYRLHARYVAGVVFRIVGHDGDLDDVVQETFVAASSHLNQLRDPAAIRPWLVAIAIRGVKSHVSRPRRRRILALQIAGFTARTSDPHDRPA